MWSSPLNPSTTNHAGQARFDDRLASGDVMLKRVLRTAAALVAAFAVKSIVPMAFQLGFGNRMLEDAGWSPGDVPPDGYMFASVSVAFLASVLAGATVAQIVSRGRVLHALAFAAVFTALAGWANRATLLDEPHPYEWPLILVPLIAMPLGAWLLQRLKHSAKDAEAHR